MAGVVTPLVIGFIVASTGSFFFFALAYVGAAALVGALSYIFIVGDVADSKWIEYILATVPYLWLDVDVAAVRCAGNFQQ